MKCDFNNKLMKIWYCSFYIICYFVNYTIISTTCEQLVSRQSLNLYIIYCIYNILSI